VSFGNLTLRRKLITIGIAASATALLICSLVFLIATYIAVQRSVRDDVVAQAAIVADNSTAALAFSDQEAATETLRALRAKPNIDVACLYDLGGDLFTFFAAADNQHCPATPPGAGQVLMATAVTITQPIVVGGRELGTLHLRGNMDELVSRMKVTAGVVLFGFIVGMTAAILIASRLERVILSPLRVLADTALRISHGSDYSLRATRQSDDEIGRLVDSFNGMVDQVERRDRRLSAANDELSRASRLKDEFLAALSHELRTPLNAILGWLQILLKTPAGPEQARRALESIERNARAQARLIEDLLDISRIVSGKFHFKSEIVELVGVVESAIESVRPAANARRIEMAVRLGDPPKVVLGDADRLRQAVWNLLSNAVKFSPAGGQVEVEMTSTPAAYSIVVRDRGIGIDPAFLPNVFDRFRQADGSMTRQHGGLGLGLAIAREIVELHGGAISAESEGPGLGSTFSVALPVVAAMRGTLPPSADAAPAVDLQGMTVLVVDDDADARELARMALTTAGAHAVVAESGSAALDAVALRRFDALVCDIAMPEYDGFTLLNLIRKGEVESGRAIPAVAVTAYAGAESRQRAQAAGFDAFLSKPYELQELLVTVARLRSGSMPRDVTA
jgi:signal transduction histidine kinase/ActR/RegA family two-component response regulator